MLNNNNTQQVVCMVSCFLTQENYFPLRPFIEKFFLSSSLPHTFPLAYTLITVWNSEICLIFLFVCCSNNVIMLVSSPEQLWKPHFFAISLSLSCLNGSIWSQDHRKVFPRFNHRNLKEGQSSLHFTWAASVSMMCLQFIFYNVRDIKGEWKGDGYLILRLSFLLKLIKAAFHIRPLPCHPVYNLSVYSIFGIAAVQQRKRNKKN